MLNGFPNVVAVKGNCCNENGVQLHNIILLVIIMKGYMIINIYSDSWW